MSFRVNRNRVSNTQIVKNSRESQSLLHLESRSSGKFLESQIRSQIDEVNRKLSYRSNNNPDEKQGRAFLPMLQRFIKIQEDTDVYNKMKIRKIIEMLFLVLLRIKYGMHIKAFEMLLYLATTLETMDSYQYHLRKLVYRLIAKQTGQVTRQMKSHHKAVRRNSRKKATKWVGKDSMSYAQLKQRLEAKLRRSRLIVQRTFLQSLQNSPETAVKLPQEIHPELSNYKEIQVSIDKQTFTYSYQYPKLLENYIHIKDYRFFISKLNAIAVPEGHCFTLHACLRMYFMPLLILAVCFFLFGLIVSIQLMVDVQSLGSRILIYSSLLFLVALIVGWRIYKNMNIYKNPLRVRNLMQLVLNDMNKRYWQKKLMIQLGETIDSFKIFVEHTEEEDNSSSSDDSESSASSQSQNEQIPTVVSLRQFFRSPNSSKDFLKPESSTKRTSINSEKRRVSLQFAELPGMEDDNIKEEEEEEDEQSSNQQQNQYTPTRTNGRPSSFGEAWASNPTTIPEAQCEEESGKAESPRVDTDTQLVEGESPQPPLKRKLTLTVDPFQYLEQN